MKIFLKTLFTLLLLTISVSRAQHAGESHAHSHGPRQVHGTVMSIETQDSHLDTIPLLGANIFWQGTSQGTTTDVHGHFHLPLPDSDHSHLIISYVSYENDTLEIDDATRELRVFLKKIRSAEGVEVTAEKPHTFHSTSSVHGVQTISGHGLRTMACCNLSESFENISAVEVEKADAISGAKHIKMLGLAGFYTKVLVEKKPVIHGLVSPFALDYIPGTWMESIDISKGTGSVTTGYESITGHINVELRKPEKELPFFFNLFQNSLGNTESSFGVSHRLNDRLSTMLLVYGTMNRMRHDQNADTFMDMPLTNHLHLMNRWKIQPKHGWEGQFGFATIYDHRDGGQSDFDFDTHSPQRAYYGFHTKTWRNEVFAKGGRMLDADGTASIGMIFSGFEHRQDAFWGLKTYRAHESSLFGNLIFQKHFGEHSLSTGLSLVHDEIAEDFNQVEYARTEKVPGAFVEFTWKPSAQLTGIAGFRYDRHNLYGDFYTPRLHLKYAFTPATQLRLSAGKGYRSPYLFVENLTILASSRALQFTESPTAEEARNYGVQLTHDFQIVDDRPVTLNLDFYRTDFQNRVIVDSEQNVGQIYIYNLKGKSYSNAAQVEINATLFDGFVSTLAYRWNDVKMTIHGNLMDQPLTNRYKGLLVFSYQTPGKKWQFDFTTQLNGKSRLPSTAINPEKYQIADYSPAYAMLFGQIKRNIKNIEIYIGLENITNYRQTNPILAWQEPFSPYFDSSLIWGPTTGRRIYVGIRVN